MPEMMDAIEGESTADAEPAEPVIRRIWVKTFSVPSGENAACVVPLVAQSKPFFRLLNLPLSKDIEHYGRKANCAAAAGGLRRVSVNAVCRGVVGDTGDVHKAVVEPDILLFQTQQFAAPQAAVDRQSTEGFPHERSGFQCI